jgi:2-phosphosulfolactate phosphatase
LRWPCCKLAAASTIFVSRLQTCIVDAKVAIVNPLVLNEQSVKLLLNTAEIRCAMPKIAVHFLPEFVPASSLPASTCVVIDVLRATTTMIEALANGASEVVPCLRVEDALQLASGQDVLGGERGGVQIAGFDLGNSPAAYVPQVVGAKRVVFTTTNGTKAMLHCRQAQQVLLAGFTNLAAVSQAIQSAKTVHIVCAGTDGEVTHEDVLVAGALVERLVQVAPVGVELADSARIARDAWLPYTQLTDAALAEALAQSAGGRNLCELGMQADIVFAAQRDCRAVVPVFADGRVTLLSRS